MVNAMVPFPALTMPDMIAFAAVPLLVAAAFRDVALRRIPNPLVAAVAAIGLTRQGAAGFGALALAVLVAAIVLLALFFLWQRGILGGGDAKLLGAAALLVPPASVPHLLLATAIAGGVLATTHLMLRKRAAMPVALPPGALGRVLRCEAWRIGRGAPLPYGVAIAAGTLFILLHPGV